MQELILREDPATADFGGKVHDFPEEILIVSGRLYDGAIGLWLEARHYASEPPDEMHGPFRSQEGCLVLDLSFPQRSVGTRQGISLMGSRSIKAAVQSPRAARSC